MKLKDLLPKQNKITIDLPKDVKDIHKIFKDNKKKLYVVGGAVRDALLDRKPKDFDLATDAKPEEVLRMVQDKGMKATSVGEKFGVIVVNDIDIATFRKDVGKGRRPDAVVYSSIDQDVKRRDLTINALVYDMDQKKIIDLVGGLNDLRIGRIRTVGSAKERFEEDPLRKLRAVRFLGQIGGKLDTDVFDALKEDPSLKGVSLNRIRDEFVKGLSKARSPEKYLKVLDDTGLLDQIFPSLDINKQFVNTRDYIINIAYLLRKNEPSTVIKVLRNLKYTAKEFNNIAFLVSLKNFVKEEVYLYKKMQARTSLKDSQIELYGSLIDLDLSKFVKFDLKVKTSDIPDDLAGKEISKWISDKEYRRFVREIKNTIKKLL